MRQNTALTSMGCFINTTVGIESILGGGEDGIEVRLSNVGFEAINILQSGTTIHGKTIWTKSNKSAWKGDQYVYGL